MPADIDWEQQLRRDAAEVHSYRYLERPTKERLAAAAEVLADLAPVLEAYARFRALGGCVSECEYDRDVDDGIVAAWTAAKARMGGAG